MTQAEFWQSFAAESDDLAERLIDGDTRAVFDRISTLLQANEIESCFDVTSDGSHGHLIFSPEGDKILGRQIDAFLAQAPELPKWKLFGRRQRKALDDARAIILDHYYQDPRDCTFHILDNGDGTIVQISVPDDPYQMTDDEKQGMIQTFLWHAVGEGFVMENNIQGTVLVRAPHCKMSVEDFIWELTLDRDQPS